MMTLLMCLSVNSGETLKDQPVFGQEHLRESHFVKGVMELYPSIPELEAQKVVGLVNYYSQELNLTPTVALAVIGTESEFVRTARSATGVGYTQVYPKYHKNKIKNRDLFKTQVNIEVGMKILQECKERTGKPGYRTALACYNGAVSKDKAERYYRKIREQEKRILVKVYQIFMTNS
jgi:soluble lytic murein transglycosylase-like protein